MCPRCPCDAYLCCAKHSTWHFSPEIGSATHAPKRVASQLPGAASQNQEVGLPPHSGKVFLPFWLAFLAAGNQRDIVDSCRELRGSIGMWDSVSAEACATQRASPLVGPCFAGGRLVAPMFNVVGIQRLCQVSLSLEAKTASVESR